MTVYLKLLHGRTDPNEQLEDWGFNGPVLGPFEAVHFTYTTHLRCFPEGSDTEVIELCYHDDLLVHDGKYYGDFEIATSFGTAAPQPALPPNRPTRKYRAEFFTASDYAVRDFEAATAEEALQLAREFYDNDTGVLDFRSYDDNAAVDRIQIWGGEHGTLAVWESDDYRLRQAARDLYKALDYFFNIMHDYDSSRRKGYIRQAMEQARAVLAKIGPKTATPSPNAASSLK